MTPRIKLAEVWDAAAIITLTGELLDEIQTCISEKVFHFDAGASQTRLEAALENGRCVVFLAHGPGTGNEPLGFLALGEAVLCWLWPGTMAAGRAGVALR